MRLDFIVFYTIYYLPIYVPKLAFDDCIIKICLNFKTFKCLCTINLLF